MNSDVGDSHLPARAQLDYLTESPGWILLPNERNQGKQAHPVLKYRVPHWSHPRPGGSRVACGLAAGVGATPWVPGGGAWHRGWAEAAGRPARGRAQRGGCASAWDRTA